MDSKTVSDKIVSTDASGRPSLWDLVLEYVRTGPSGEPFFERRVQVFCPRSTINWKNLIFRIQIFSRRTKMRTNDVRVRRTLVPMTKYRVFMAFSRNQNLSLTVRQEITNPAYAWWKVHPLTNQRDPVSDYDVTNKEGSLIANSSLIRNQIFRKSILIKIEKSPRHENDSRSEDTTTPANQKQRNLGK